MILFHYFFLLNKISFLALEFHFKTKVEQNLRK